MKKTTCTTALASSTVAGELFLSTEEQQEEQQAAALLERTVQEIQALNTIYNDDETTTSSSLDDNDDDDDESSYTKFTIVSREAFQAAQNLISKTGQGQESKHSSLLDNNDSLNTSSFAVSRPGSISLEVRINVVLTSADGVKFEANVDITLPPNYPEEAALITKASITDLDLGREIEEFRQEMNRKSKELSGSEALEDMIQCVQDYAAEYIANYGHERVLDDSWNRRPSYFTSCASPNGAMYHYYHQGETTIEQEQQQLDCCKTTTTSSSSTTMNAATSYSRAGGTKRKRNDVVKVHSRSTVKSYKAKKSKRNQSQSRTFEQRLEDLKMFKEEHGHCIVPYTYAKNQPLSANWCSNIRYSYGLLERGLNPTIKMTEERINALRDIGFDFSALKEQHLKRRVQDFDEDDGSSSEQRVGGAYHATSIS